MRIQIIHRIHIKIDSNFSRNFQNHNLAYNETIENLPTSEKKMRVNRQTR